MTLKKFFGSAAIISIIGVALWICKKIENLPSMICAE